MSTEEKLQISKAVVEWIDENNKDRSASQLSKKSGVNIRYIVAIRRGDTYTEQDGRQIEIADKHYIKIREVVMGADNGVHFDNSNFQKIQSACQFAQTTHRRVLIDSMDSGAGKTYGLEYYARVTPNTLYVKITSLMKGRDLIELLSDKLNLKYEKRVSNTRKLHDINDRLAVPGYLIILDEMESCSPDVYRVLKDIEDATYRRCGLVICGLGLTAEMESAAKRRKKLMPQLWRRFRSNRVMLRHLSRADIAATCKENGIKDMAAIKVLQDMITDWAMLAEYIYDIKTLLIDKGEDVNALNVRSLFFNEAA